MRLMRSVMYGLVPVAASFHAPELEMSWSSCRRHASSWRVMPVVMLPRVMVVAAWSPVRSCSICRMRPSRRRGVGKLVSMMWTVSPMSVPSALTPAAARLVTSHSYETTGWLRVLSASLVSVRSCLGSSQSGNSASASLWMRVPLGPGMPHMASAVASST